MWRGAGGGGCHDQDVIVTAPPHMETGGGQTHYPAHDTGGGEPRVTAITQSGDDKINIGDRDDTKLAIAAD